MEFGPSDVAVALTNPANFSLVISGGLQGNEMFPVTGNFERLQVNLGKLAASVATVLESSTGLDLEQFPGQIFAAPAEFPIEGLDGLTIGIEPVELPGGISIGGTLGLGVYTFNRPNDVGNGTTEQKVFYGIVEGEIHRGENRLGCGTDHHAVRPGVGAVEGGSSHPVGHAGRCIRRSRRCGGRYGEWNVGHGPTGRNCLWRRPVAGRAGTNRYLQRATDPSAAQGHSHRCSQCGGGTCF